MKNNPFNKTPNCDGEAFCNCRANNADYLLCVLREVIYECD